MVCDPWEHEHRCVCCAAVFGRTSRHYSSTIYGSVGLLCTGSYGARVLMVVLERSALNSIMFDDERMKVILYIPRVPCQKSCLYTGSYRMCA